MIAHDIYNILDVYDIPLVSVSQNSILFFDYPFFTIIFINQNNKISFIIKTLKL